MAKIVLQDTSSGYNLSTINANFDAIEDIINNKMLSRDNPSGDPNQMNVDLDMNGQDILNLNSLNVHSLNVDGIPVTDEFNEAIASATVAANQSAASAVASASSAAAAVTTYNTFLKNFLGAFASDPSAVGIIDGALYYNSTTAELKYLRNGLWISFPQASQVGRQAFVNGTDYTAGTSTTLTLPATTYTKTILWVMFDGSYVQPNQFNLTSQTLLTLTGPIPSGVSRIEVAYIAPLASAIIDDLSITTSKLAANSVTEGKLAPSSVGTTEIIDGNITNVKLASNSVTADKLGAIGPIQRVLDLPITVESISSLRLVDKTTGPMIVYTAGYYSSGDGGASQYYLDPSDSTSSDNLGSIIVANDGGRWKIIQSRPMSTKQWGVHHDGATDDWGLITNALTNTPVGGELILDMGMCRVSATVQVYAGKTLQGLSGNAGAAAIPFPAGIGYCGLIGDLAVSPVVQLTVGITVASGKIADFNVTRASGTITSGMIGVQTDSIDNSQCIRINSYRHGCGFNCAGQLSPFFQECNSWYCTDAHLVIQNCVEPRFIQCRFGRNGNVDATCNYYVKLVGAAVDTVRFDSCQFNQSGAQVSIVMGFIGYVSNPNGLIHFVNCHAENWTTAMFAATSGTNTIPRLKIIGCSFTSSGSSGLLYSGASSVITDWNLSASNLDISATFDQCNGVTVTGCTISGPWLFNAGGYAFTGNYCKANMTFTGAVSHAVVCGNAFAGGAASSATGAYSYTGNA